MEVPPVVAWVRPERINASSGQTVSGRWLRLLLTALLMLCLTIAGYFLYQQYSNQNQVADRDLEIRLDFIPFRPRREFPDSLSLILRGDGKVRVVLHRREMFVDAVYEGALPEADTMRLIARARQARSEWTLPKLQAGDDALFRMAVVSVGSSDEKSVFGGNLADASERTRSFIEELLTLWNWLEKVPRAEAYVRCIPFLEEELKRIERNEQRSFLPVEKVPVELQPILIKSLNQPRDFIPLTRTQHDQLLDYRQFIITNNGFSYRLALTLPTPLPTN